MSGPCIPSYRAGFYSPRRGGRPKYPELWAGCVGAWSPTLGNTGTTLFDHSPYRRNGNLRNMATPTSNWILDSFGHSILFDGSNDEIVIPSSSRAEPLAKTLCCWMYRTSATSCHMCGRWNTVINERVIAIYGTATVIRGAVSGDGTQNASYEASYTGTLLNAWYHMAVTWSAGSPARLFVNGDVLATSASSPSSLRSNSIDFTIGRMASGNLPFTGRITDVRNYDRVLTGREIRLLARRPGIAYEREPKRRLYVPAGGGTPVSLTAGAGAGTGSGHAPTPMAGVQPGAGAGAGTGAGGQPSLSIGSIIAGGAGSGAGAGHAPNLNVGGAVLLSAGLGTGTGAGKQPTLILGSVLSPGRGTGTGAGAQPSLELGAFISLFAGAGTGSGKQPTLTTGATATGTRRTGLFLAGGLFV